MAEEKSTIKKIFSDWQVLVVIALVVIALLSIYALPPALDNGVSGNLQLGLDLVGGSWVQLSFQSEVISYESDMSQSDFISQLSEKLDADVIAVTSNSVEIRKYFTKEELEDTLSGMDSKLVTYEQGISKSTADTVKDILEDKVNTLGTKDVQINTLTGANDVTKYIRVELAGTDINTAQDIVSSQGKFEIRIITTGNESEHVLFGEDVTSVSTPTQDNNNWGVSFTLSSEGAEALRDACIEYGAVNDPEAHHLVMLLDGEEVYDAPLATGLASELMKGSVRELSASTGYGEEGFQEAEALEIHLRAGALPVDVEIASSDYVPPEHAETIKIVCIAAAIIALLAVAGVVYYRYREPSIVFPMILTNIAEIIILLGIARYIQQLDLASIAGLIAVIGTGIDQLVIITDEVLHEGRVPSPSLYLKRFKRALGIITVSASTTIFAMIPLALMDLSTLKGFAIITILGVLVGVLITRPAYGKVIMAILSKKPAK